MKFKKQKKIVLLNSSLAGGGSERVCVNMANSFAKKGWQVDLVVLNLNNQAYLHSILDNVNLIVLNVNHARYSAIYLLRYIFKNKPKIILVFNSELSVVMVILRILLRLNVKIISRNTSTLSIRLKEFKKKKLWLKYVAGPLIKFFYKRIDYAINQCKGMREDLIQLLPQFYEKSNVIYNPIPPEIIDYVNKNDLTQIKKKDYLLCVGRLEKVKAFHYAIESFAGIADNFSNLRLKIVGKGSLEQELKQKAIDCCVDDRVDFEGFQENIIPYYLYAKATILTSLYEGYPNVLIESIAMNTPVIAFNCESGPKEIIQEGINGYLVKYKNVDDLKKKLTILLLSKFDNEDLKNSIKNNQIENILENYEKLIDLLTQN